MRRFLVRLLLAAVLGVVSLVMLTAARIVLWQKDVDAHYVIPDEALLDLAVHIQDAISAKIQNSRPRISGVRHGGHCFR